MCYIACRVCDEGGYYPACPKCEHILEQWLAMEDKLHKTENELHSVSDRVKKVLSKHAEKLNEVLDTEAIEDLWEAIEAKKWESAKSFLSERCVDGAVSLDAKDLFRKEPKRHKKTAHEKRSIMEKLQHLYEACKTSDKFHGWDDDYGMDMTPEDLRKQFLKETKRTWWKSEN